MNINILNNTNLTDTEKEEILILIGSVIQGDSESEKVIEQAFQKDPNLGYKIRDILVAKKKAIGSGSKEDFDKVLFEEEKILEALG